MLSKKEYQGEPLIKEQVTTLLEEAFPVDERPPTKYFFASLDKKENKLYAYYLNDTFIGFAYLTLYKDIIYIFFLAVSKDKRHQGYGGEILEDIKSSYPDYVKLLCYEEVDPKYDNYDERVQRQYFYKSHGFISNKLKTNEYGVIFETAYIGSHLVDFASYIEIFVLGFGERSRKHIKQA